MTTLRRRLALLGALYFVQGLPFGFQASALPLYLRERGASLTAISIAGALALPWMLKALWAPVVDRYSIKGFGRRRSWIVPLQALLSLLCLVAAFATGGVSMVPLLTLVLLMNFAAATMDIAVDGLAVDVLSERHLGYGNIAQVVGYKLGMLTGGGLLVWLTADFGWRGLFLAMSALVAVILLATSFFREWSATAHSAGPSALGRGDPKFSEIMRRLKDIARSPGMVWVLLLIGTYKIGESMADMLFRPFLLDAGFSASQIGLWLGTWGMAFSIVGSFVGGFAASKLPIVRALFVVALFRAVPLLGQWWISLGTPDETWVIAVTCAEHFFGGALTTAMFAFMMSQVDKTIGATHYTVLATVEVAGKAPGGYLAGVLGDAFGYAPALLLSAVLAVLYLTVFAGFAASRKGSGSSL